MHLIYYEFNFEIKLQLLLKFSAIDLYISFKKLIANSFGSRLLVGLHNFTDILWEDKIQFFPRDILLKTFNNSFAMSA